MLRAGSGGHWVVAEIQSGRYIRLGALYPLTIAAFRQIDPWLFAGDILTGTLAVAGVPGATEMVVFNVVPPPVIVTAPKVTPGVVELTTQLAPVVSPVAAAIVNCSAAADAPEPTGFKVAAVKVPAVVKLKNEGST